MNDNSNGGHLKAPKPRWRRLLQNLALSAGTFLLCLVVFEVVLRFNGYGNLEIYVPDKKLYWRLKPGQDCYTKVGHKPVHINSHGTRGPDFQTGKPPNTLRILSLGDSRTFGWGLTEAETYSRRLQELLQQQIGATEKVEVINAGVNAWSYPQLLVYFRDWGLGYRPDYVILAEANWGTQFSEKNSPEFVKKLMLRVRLKSFLRRFAIYNFVVETELRNFYNQERLKFIPVDPKQDPLFKEQQQSDPDAVYREAIEGLCRLAQTNHVKPVLLFLPAVDEQTVNGRMQLLEIKRVASQKLGVPLVDMTADLQPQGKALYLDADPVHLNAQGNAMVAERLFETLTNSLTK